MQLLASTLPEGHSWEGKNTVSLDYPIPDNLKNGKCLKVIGHSNDLEHTLNTFFRKIHFTDIPLSSSPEKDYIILYPYLYRQVGFYFSIAEMLTFVGKDINHDTGWRIFKGLLKNKEDERNKVLNLQTETREEVQDILE